GGVQAGCNAAGLLEWAEALPHTFSLMRCGYARPQRMEGGDERVFRAAAAREVVVEVKPLLLVPHQAIHGVLARFRYFAPVFRLWILAESGRDLLQVSFLFVEQAVQVHCGIVVGLCA